MENEYLVGQFRIVVFYNEDNGYTVAKFTPENKNMKDITITGVFNNVDMNSVYKLNGKYLKHPKYGMQYAVESYEKVLPTNTDGIIRLLCSDVFPYIGKKTATLLVDHLGEGIFDTLKEDPSILLNFDFISKRKYDGILTGLDRMQNDNISTFLISHGFSMRNIQKIVVTYQSNALNIINDNPYILIENINGLGFDKVDKLAYSLGFDKNDSKRLRGIIITTIKKNNFETGNTYISKYDLIALIVKKYGFDEYSVKEMIFDLISKTIIYEKNNCISHYEQYESEVLISQFLSSFDIKLLNDINFDKEIKLIEDELCITYATQQKEAIKNFFNRSFNIITGGPGTGKTTIVAAILKLYNKFMPCSNFALVAPTGRAAKRLGELSEGNSMTIHSLLKWDLESNKFAINENEPLLYDTLIIDEFSMVDNHLFSSLLKACNNVKRILIIGDENQLPSVGPGCVLRDLIAFNKFKTSRLDIIFRQKGNSEIINLSHNIKEGIVDITNNSEVVFYDIDKYRITNNIITIIKNALDNGYTLDDIQVLIPKYNGLNGIDSINIALQNEFNLNDNCMNYGGKQYRINDKVIQLKNQPDDNVYNGDIGIVKDIYIDENKEKVLLALFDNNIVKYTNDDLLNLNLAYAISVHKSQGSEYPIVIMPICNDYIFMLNRALIYTAITRAKSTLILIGDKNTLINGIDEKRTIARETCLIDRLNDSFNIVVS